jgi:ATP-binding cassette subfamily B protein
MTTKSSRMNQSLRGDFHIYLRVLVHAKRYLPHIIVIFLISLLASPLALLSPVPLKIAVDSVISDQPLPGFLQPIVPDSVSTSSTDLLVFAAAMVVVIAILNEIQSQSSSMLRRYTGEKLVMGIRAKLFRHAQRLSLSHHDSTGATNFTYRIQYDAPAFESISVDGVIPFFTSGVTLVSMLYVTLSLDLELGLYAIAIGPPLILVAQLSRRTLRTQSRDVKNLESSALSMAQEALAAIRVVKAFGQEDYEENRFVNRYSQSMRSRLKLLLVSNFFSVLTTLVTSAGTAGVLFIGASHVRSGTLTLGEFLLVMTYLSQLYGPLRNISKKAAGMQSSLASAERVFAVLDEAPDVLDRPDARSLERAGGSVSFRNVTFGYVPERPVLKEVSFQVPPGARVGISGATGAGKTTLMSLLMRFYDPDEGAILVDGTDIREYRLADLRNQFAVVLQEPILFSSSIGENIAYARPEATGEEIVAAAKAASIHDFILTLPDGYDTLVGERGQLLSGGERQRISLARAFLKDAPMLILDEPTSSVDMKTEAAIMEAMQRLMEGRTSFMIAHRLSTLDACDVRLLLEEGTLVEPAADGRDGEQPAKSVGPVPKWISSLRRRS